jgi:hypothetical protein
MGITTALFRPLMLVVFAGVGKLSGLVSQPDGDPRGRAPGENPDRILVFGNGTAMGWGVASHDAALPGHLAREITAITGRGTDVELVADASMTMESALSRLRSVNLWWYDGVVITIGNGEAMCLLPPERWRRAMDGLLRHAEDETPAATPIVVIGITAVASIQVFRGLLAFVGDRHATVLNRITMKVCAELPDARYHLLDAPDLAAATRDSYSDVYRVWAGSIAEVLAPRLPPPL